MPILTGGGSMYSTVDDLQRWDSAAGGGSLLSTEGLAVLETSHAYRGPQTRYGYGWQFPVLEQEEGGGEIEMRHGGGLPGFTSHILRCATQPPQPHAQLRTLMLSCPVRRLVVVQGEGARCCGAEPRVRCVRLQHALRRMCRARHRPRRRLPLAAAGPLRTER